MSQLKKLVPLKRVLQNSFDNDSLQRYLQGVDPIDSSKGANIYQEALQHLLDGNMEKAINYVVYGLDIDRNNKLLFNLSKNMIFVLSKHLADNNADFYKQKYNDNLTKAIKMIKKRIRELEKKLKPLKIKLSDLEKQLDACKPKFFSFTKLYFIYKIKSKNLKPSINDLSGKVNDLSSNIDSLVSDLELIKDLEEKEQFIKVLSLSLEVCIFPTKFEWASAN